MTDERAEASGANERSARPAFAREFPPHPELDALVAAFEAGDFRTVRSGASKLAASDAGDAVKSAARQLATYLLVLTAVLLVALTAYWTHHSGAAAPP